MRGRQPGASARLCGAGAARWRAADTAGAGQRARRRTSCGEEDWEGGAGLGARACVHGEGRRRCRPDPNPFSPAPRVRSGKDPARAVLALRPEACHPALLAPLWREREAERGIGRRQRGGRAARSGGGEGRAPPAPRAPGSRGALGGQWAAGRAARRRLEEAAERSAGGSGERPAVAGRLLASLGLWAPH